MNLKFNIRFLWVFIPFLLADGWKLQGETVIFPAGRASELRIDSDELLRVSYSGNPFHGGIVLGNITNKIRFQRTFSPFQPLISGPAVLISYGETTQTLSFRRVKNPGVQSIVLVPGQTNSIAVGSNETVKLFPPMTDRATSCAAMEFAVGTNIITGLPYPEDGGEIHGPMIVRFYQEYGCQHSPVVSVYIAKEFESQSVNGATAAPVGGSLLSIEKSKDLLNWSPAYLNFELNDSRAFYRFKVIR